MGLGAAQQRRQLSGRESEVAKMRGGRWCAWAIGGDEAGGVAGLLGGADLLCCCAAATLMWLRTLNFVLVQRDLGQARPPSGRSASA